MRYENLLEELKNLAQSVSFLQQLIVDLKEKTVGSDGIEDVIQENLRILMALYFNNV